jgi:copper ion binding protein
MSSTLTEVTLTAPDISCGHCVATVKSAVGALAGVASVEASEATKQIDVSFDPNRVSLDQIEAALDDAGYPVQK